MLLVVLAIVASSLVQAPQADAAKARPKCLGKRATIVGNKKANTLKGTKKADVIVGLGGSDRIIGGGGGDRICGGPGKDRIYGGKGNDRLDGGKGADECRQEAGTGPKRNCEGPKFQLAVSKIGSGTVASSPSGIDCGTACASDFMEGQTVSLTASAAGGSTFSGWGGACTGSGSCAVSMSKAHSVAATFTAAAPSSPPPANFTLTVSTSGSGSGTLSSSPAGISCGADCSEAYVQGTTVTLSASPAEGSVFSGWSGTCSGTGNCVVAIDAAKNVTATFLLARTLTVNRNGTGSGTVTSSPVGINCGSDCTEVYGDGTSVTLTAASNIGSTFGGWSGCDSSSGVQCTVAMSASRTVEATFNPTNFTLTVTRDGSGNGSVASSPSGISCPTDCTESYPAGQTVTLTATPDSGSLFTAWSGGGCSGTGTCVVTMDAAKTVNATFTIARTLTVSKAGNGSGTVTSSPVGITCGPDCTDDYPDGTVVTLTANAASGSSFTQWAGGGCSGTGNCIVTLNVSQTITATFTLLQYNLTVNRTGSGTVTSSPSGISCGGDCSQIYDHGTVVTLSASADPGWQFSGWSGEGCSGTGNCQVTMDAAKTVSATFLERFTLDVTKTGTGTGTVTSSPSGINCGADCTNDYSDGQPVTLTATANSGSTFNGWTGCDSPSGNQCTMTMNADKTVNAQFTQITHQLTVNKTGAGSGTVSSSPSGITCGVDCTELFNEGQVVTLTAAADSGSVFTGWSGAGCSGTGSCIVTMDAAKTVTANFVLGRTLTVNKAGNGGGTVVSDTGNINCGSTCSDSYVDGTSVVLTATPDSNSTFTSWSGCTSENGNQCTVLMNSNKTVTATFTKITYNLHVDRTGLSPGTVTSSPSGINCGSDCDQVYDSGTSVTLTAGGLGFLSWDGCDSSSGNQCTVAMTSAKTVTANYVGG